MAMFEPLREGFRELNNMLTDRQTFNAQQEANQARDERANTILASQLEERAFNRAALEKRMLMGADMNEFQKDMATKRFDQSKTQFDINQDMEAQKMQLASDSAQITRDYQNAQIEKINADLDESYDDKEPRSLRDQTEGSGLWNTSPETKQRVAEVVYGGMYDEERDEIVDEDGKEIKISAQEQRKVARRVRGLMADETNNMQTTAMQRVGEINGQLQTLQKEMRHSATSLGSDVRNKANLAKIKVETNRLMKELGEAEAKAGPAGAALDREKSIEDKQSAIVQAYDIGDIAYARTLETEVAEMRAAEVAETAATRKGGTAKTKFVIQVDEGGNPILGSGKMLPERANLPPGHVLGADYNMIDKADMNREKMFTQEAKELYGKEGGISGELIVGVENNELYDGLRRVMRIMRSAEDFADMSDAEIASEAKREHASTMQDYFVRGKKISQIEDPVKQQELLDLLDAQVIEVLGSIPTEKAYNRMLKLNLIEQTQELEQEEDDSWF